MADHRTPKAAAAGIIASGIDRVVSAVESDDHEELTDEETVSAASKAWLAPAALAAIALTEFAYGARSEQLDQAPGGMVTWVPTSDNPCAECSDRADEDPIPSGDADPDGLHPNCSCSWVDVTPASATASGHPQVVVEGLTWPTMPDTLTASAIKVHHTGTDDASAWDATANSRKLSNDDGEAVYRQAFAWQDGEKDPDKKNAYKFPHHHVSSDGTVGDASVAACSAVVAVLNGGRGTDVKAQDWYPDRDGIASHVLAHLKDAGVEDADMPKLDDMKVVGVRQAMKAATDPLPDPGPTVAPQWHGIIITEGRSSGRRTVEPGATSWRPLPLTGTRDHCDDKIAARATNIFRDEFGRVVIEGVYDDGEVGQDTARLVEAQTIRWLSYEPDENYESILIDATTGAPIMDWDEMEPNTKVEELITKLVIGCFSFVTAGAYVDSVVCPIGVPLPDPAPVLTLVASASATVAAVKDEKPPAEWFHNPNRQGRAGQDLHEAGAYVYVEGYVAPWGIAHVGRPDRRFAPRSAHADYPYFRQGHVLTAGGKVPTGSLTIGTGHCMDDYASADEARSHYDNTGTKWAAVAAGEDDYGLWAAGMCRPDITKPQLWAARASAWSGDWRDIAGDLELVAVLSVNVPGFPQAVTAGGADVIVLPTERFRCAMRGGRPVSLVAAALSYPDPMGDALRALSAKVADLEYRMSPEYRAQQAAAEAKIAERRARLQPVG